jgi:hypothetical protein
MSRGRRIPATLATGALLALLLTPAHAAGSKPQAVSLRLGSVKQSPRLFAPGLAMSRASRTLMPGQSLTFPSEPLRRPLTIDSRPFLRLHLSHTVPGDVTLYVRIQVLGAEGVVRDILPNQALVAPETVLAKGPQADIDLRMPHVIARLAAKDQLQVVLSELSSSPTDALHPDVLTVYLGALPGEDTDTHDMGQVLDESKGGKDPARLTLRVTGDGPFQEW